MLVCPNNMHTRHEAMTSLAVGLVGPSSSSSSSRWGWSHLTVQRPATDRALCRHLPRHTATDLQQAQVPPP